MIVRLQTGIASSPRPRPRNRKFAAGRRRNAAEHVNSGYLEIVHAKFHDRTNSIKTLGRACLRRIAAENHNSTWPM